MSEVICLSTIEVTTEEARVIKELRSISWGKLTVIKKNGAIVMISPSQVRNSLFCSMLPAFFVS